MLEIDFREITANADLEKLLQLFVENREHIYDLLLERLREQGSTPYIRFVADHPEGQERTRRYLDAFEQALGGRVKVFFDDQKRIGYKRALQGYRLEDVFTHKIIFKKVILESINTYNANQQDNEGLININDIIFIDLLLDYSNYLLAYSFLQTRDEIISRRKNQIQQLHRYATKIVSIFEEEELRACAKQGVIDIFGLHASFSLPSAEKGDHNTREQEELTGYKNPFKLVKNIGREVTYSDRTLAIDANDKTIRLDEKTNQDCFKAIYIPLHRGSLDMIVPFFIHDQGRIFKLDKPDRNLLYQFSYFTGAVLSNCLMVSQLAQKQQELRKLAGKLISIKEEENKRIAAEIHDTITQALTAIGYKALLCQELAEKDFSRLNDELDCLVDNINDALRQSRYMMSNLRPRILDDLGILATFKKVVTDFEKDYKFELNLDKDRKQEFSTEKLVNGRYKLKIDWEDGEKAYFQEIEVNL